MNKYFFSLISGDKIHIAPKTKIIPAEQFSKLMNAHEIMAKVEKDAEAYKIQVVSECEKLKEEAEKQGYKAGFQAWVQQIATLQTETDEIRKTSEKMILPIALKAAKKIVGKEIELSSDTIVNIVSTYLKAVSTHKKITIYVSRKDLQVLEKNRASLKEIFEGLETLSIQERLDIEPGGCIIETEGGIINAKLEN